MTARGKCPVCKKPAAPEYRPFCSKRCADVDLGRWMTERYVVPGEDGDAAEQLPSAPLDEDEADDGR